MSALKASQFITQVRFQGNSVTVDTISVTFENLDFDALRPYILTKTMKKIMIGHFLQKRISRVKTFENGALLDRELKMNEVAFGTPDVINWSEPKSSQYKSSLDWCPQKGSRAPGN